MKKHDTLPLTQVVKTLPNGWRWERLSGLCDIRHGGTPSKDNATFWSGEIPWISSKDMKADILAGSRDHVSKEAIKRSSASIIPAGTVLAVVRSGILTHRFPVALAGRDLAFNQDIKALIPKKSLVDSEFLFFALRSKESEILSEGIKKGATVHSIKSGYLENLRIQLPSVSEQKRIAGILNERMAAIDKARAAAEARLVAAKVLPEAYLRQVFPQEGLPLPPGWDWAFLGRLCDVVNGFGFPEYLQGKDDGPYPFIKVSDMNSAGAEEIVSSAANMIDQEIVRALRAKIYPAGTIIFPKVGGALLTNKKRILGKEGSFDNNVMGLVPKGIEFRYLYYWIQTVDLRSLSNTQALPSIKQSRVAALKIPVPPLATQLYISAMLMEKFTTANRLILKLERLISEINALPQALLRQAFNGEL